MPWAPSCQNCCQKVSALGKSPEGGWPGDWGSWMWAAGVWVLTWCPSSLFPLGFSLLLCVVRTPSSPLVLGFSLVHLQAPLTPLSSASSEVPSLHQRFWGLQERVEGAVWGLFPSCLPRCVLPHYFFLPEEEEPFQSTNQDSYGSSPGKAPQGPHQGPDDFGSDPRDPPNFYRYAGMTAAAVIGGVMAVRAVPELLDTVGFTRKGISRSSLAAEMMSSTARANGGGVPSGSLVSNLQSKGATGLSTPSNILLGSAGALLGALLWDSYSSSRRTQY
uniref:Interferon alpha-inducible protein 27-like protein 2 n=1 Tax=Bos indicus x Bos taurus TaxID=30522 RepID=A0A4W2G8N7_BOBOX